MQTAFRRAGQWWLDLRLQWKLMGAFGQMLVLMLGISVVAVVITRKGRESAANVTAAYDAIDRAGMAMQALQTMEANYRGYLVTGNDQFLGQLDTAKTAYFATLAGLRKRDAADSARAARWSSLEEKAAQWQEIIIAPGIEMRRGIAAGTSRFDELVTWESSGISKQLFDEMRAMVDSSVTDERARLATTSADDAARAGALLQIVLWGSLAIVLVGMGIAWVISNRVIGQPLEALAAAADRVAAGDTAVEVPVRGRDEIGRLALSLRSLVSAERDLAHVAVAIAAGDMTVDVPVRGDGDQLGRAFRELRATVQGITQETGRLVAAARDGDLGQRGEAARYQGSYRALVADLNGLLDAVAAPMTEAVRVLERVAERDLTARMTGEYRGDFAAMELALNSAVGEMRRAVSVIAQNSTTLDSAAEELAAVAGEMETSASATSSRAGVVSTAAAGVSGSVTMVAAGTQQMGASIREIAQSAGEAARVAQQAVAAAQTTNATVAKLGASSAEIGQVIKLITSIAEQTNLLALNATIEAARAGEAGKGFAVVANEVKELAKETARATDEIGRKIETIQGDSRQAVGAIGEINGIVTRIAEIQTTIAGAVEQQTSTTNEMGRSLDEAAGGSSDIAEHIVGVASAAERTSEGAAQSQQAAADLARLAAELQTLVGEFTYDGSPARAGRLPALAAR